MPEGTEWEQIIDKMVDANTEVSFEVYSNEGHPQPAGDTLVRDHDYYFDLTILNIGTEVHFDKLQARCLAKKLVQNVVFYTDDTYSTPTQRVHLNWEDVRAGKSVEGTVHFRVTQDMKDANIVHYGIYGVVRPEGHVWNTLNWNANKGPQ